MLHLPVHPKHSLAPLFIMLLCIILWIVEPTSSQLLAFDRASLDDHQWWRMLSGHLLHTNHMHLLLNLAGVMLLWALHGHYYSFFSYLVVLIILCIGTSVSLYLFSHDMQWYVGLSGALHGLFIVGAYFDIRHRFKSGWLMLIGVWIKVLHEQIYGASDQVSALIEANVAIDAHLFGTAVGTVVIIVYFFVDKLADKKLSKKRDLA